MIQTCRILLSEAVAGRHRPSAAAGWLADAGRSPATDGWPGAPAPLVAAAVPLNPPIRAQTATAIADEPAAATRFRVRVARPAPGLIAHMACCPPWRPAPPAPA